MPCDSLQVCIGKPVINPHQHDMIGIILWQKANTMEYKKCDYFPHVRFSSPFAVHYEAFLAWRRNSMATWDNSVLERLTISKCSKSTSTVSKIRVQTDLTVHWTTYCFVFLSFLSFYITETPNTFSQRCSKISAWDRGLIYQWYIHFLRKWNRAFVIQYLAASQR